MAETTIYSKSKTEQQIDKKLQSVDELDDDTFFKMEIGDFIYITGTAAQNSLNAMDSVPQTANNAMLRMAKTKMAITKQPTITRVVKKDEKEMTLSYREMRIN